jgi:sigma-E factor negative regulatory protein RseA
MTEERDSQLSAMFDDELPVGECELLARRLSRDEALRAQWSRYSMIGAALRAERGVALHDRVAWKVQSVIAQETTYEDGAALDSTRAVTAASASRAAARQRWTRFALPVAGASIAASVAAVSIFWLRGSQQPDEALMASNPAPTTIVLTPDAGDTAVVAMNDNPVAAPEPRSSGEPNEYIVPPPSNSTNLAPPARLANYVVAHSEYSSPLSRRMALLGIVGADGDAAAPEEAPAPEDSDAP